MKKFITSKSYLILYFLTLLLFLGLACLCIIYDVMCVLENSNFGPGFLWGGIFLLLTVFCTFCLNRLSCFVWFETNMIKRRGLFCGFKRESKIEEIISIEIRHLYRDGDFIFLIDEKEYSDKMFDRFRKDSFICIRKNKINLDFIRCFFDTDIMITEKK